jgi:hypothetical protein
MRLVCAVTAAALLVGLALTAQASAPSAQGPTVPDAVRNTPPRLSQNLPSDVEQKLGIRPNSANRDRRGVEYRYNGPGGPGGAFGGPGYRDRRDQCERRALQRGLDGREFRRFVRWCMDR